MIAAAGAATGRAVARPRPPEAGQALDAGTITATPGNNQVVLAGNAATGGTSPYTYQWHRSTSGGFTPSGGTALAGLTSLSETDTTATNGTTYYYKLVVTDNVAATATSAQASATPNALTDDGPGANEPAGMSAWAILDVTQSDQASKNAATLAGDTSFEGTPWHTPDSTGGAYFNQTVAGSTCMEFRWLVGSPGDGRTALAEWTTATEYSEVYIRYIARLSDPHHPWPSGTIKMVDFDEGNVVQNFSGTPDNTGVRHFLGNVSSSIGGVGYWTHATNYAPNLDEWVEVEIHAVYNSDGTTGDGTYRLWINGTEIAGSGVWDNLGGADPADHPVDVIFTSDATPGFKKFKFGPYRGGSGGSAIANQTSIWFRGCYVSVKEAA